MKEAHSILRDILLITQFLSALIGFIYLFKLKKNYWKWFSIYLIIIFIQECFWINNTSIEKQYQVAYYTFLGLPLQFIFLYWLYALKSLKNKMLFIISVLIFIISLGLFTLIKDLHELPSLSINVGSTILIYLLILEFIKQIKTDNILKFKENKMFYINIGLVLFYVGSYPYHVFSRELYENYHDVWNVYYIYFQATNCIMYLLFSVSFIWGKTQL